MRGPQVFHRASPMRKSQSSSEGGLTNGSSAAFTRLSNEANKDHGDGKNKPVARSSKDLFRRTKSKRSDQQAPKEQTVPTETTTSQRAATPTDQTQHAESSDPPRHVQRHHRKSPSLLLGVENVSQRRDSETLANSQSEAPRASGSTSTLRSFYDAHKTPLAISQQTSNSSARDFALRKGCPRVVSGRNGEELYPCTCNKSHHSKTLPPRRKQRPAHMDLSNVFSKAGGDSMLSTQFYDDCPTGSSANSDHLSAIPPSVGATRHNHLRRMRSTGRTLSNQRLEQPMKFLADTSSASVKINVRRPKAGTNHWFDDLEVDSSDDDSNDEPEFQADFVAGIESALNRGNFPLQSNATAAIKQISGSRNTVEVSAASNSKDARFLDGQTLLSPTSASLRLALESWEKRNNSQDSDRMEPEDDSRKVKAGGFDGADLQKESILFLSSDDEEEEEEDDDDDEDEDEDEERDDGDHEPQKVYRRLPRQRDSAGLLSLNDSDMEFGVAKAIRTNKSEISSSQASKEAKLKHTSYLSDQSATSPVAATKATDRGRGRLQSNTDSLRKQALNGEKSTFPTGAPVQPDVRNSTRLVPVTKQEASLLEAMRSKKASMRYDILAEAYRSALEAGRQARAAPYSQPSPGLEIADASFLHLSQGPISPRRESSENECPMHAEEWEMSGTFSGSSSATDPLSDPNSSSRRGSSMLSDTLTSPTTNRDMPATPTLPSLQDGLAPRGKNSTLKYHPNSTTKDYHDQPRIRSDQSEDLATWNYHGWGNQARVGLVR